MALYRQVYFSPMGELYLVADEHHLLELRTKPSVNYEISDLGTTAPITLALKWLDDYFFSKKPVTDLVPLNPSGTEFQKLVWEKLLKIPYGQTITYGQLAAQIASEKEIQKMSAQAVGQAVGANPIGIIIPCHRVIGAGGKLTGYAGGLDKKRFLLTHEKAL